MFTAKYLITSILRLPKKLKALVNLCWAPFKKSLSKIAIFVWKFEPSKMLTPFATG